MQSGELQIFGPEIVAPLADAMGLVDGEQRYFAAFDLGQETVGHQPLGGDIDDRQLAGPHLPLDLHLVGIGYRGIETGRLDAQLGQRLHLVAHQGDQRRNDNRDTVSTQCRDLIAQRLTAAGRHQHHGVAAGDDVIDDLGLGPAKLVVTENGAQDIERGGHGSGSSGENRTRQLPCGFAGERIPAYGIAQAECR